MDATLTNLITITTTTTNTFQKIYDNPQFRGIQGGLCSLRGGGRGVIN